MKPFIISLFMIILCACGTQDDHKTPIAILTPSTHPSLEQIEKGFVDTMEKAYPGRYRFDTYNAQGNKTLMRSEIEEIARKNYALVFTLGTTPSQMTVEIFGKKGLNTPIVFTAVNDPVTFNIVKSEEAPGGTATGVKELVNFRNELAALLKYKPEIKTLLLVYNSTGAGLQKDQKEIEGILKEKNISLINVEIFQSNELLAKVSPFIEKADAVVILKDDTVVSGLDLLVKLCNRHQVPLMASDLDSPDRGAAFGYGVYEIEFGIEGARKALKILNENISPGDFPVTSIANFSLRINREAAIKQGIYPSALEIDLEAL